MTTKRSPRNADSTLSRTESASQPTTFVAAEAAPSLTDRKPLQSLERRAAYRLSLLSNLSDGVLAQMYKSEFGLTVADWKTLAIVGHYEPVFSGAIAERTSMVPEQVSRALVRLAQKGVIERSFDESDRRRVVVTLSERGREVFEEIESVRSELEEDLFKVLSVTEREMLFKILDKLDHRARDRFTSPEAWKRYVSSEAC